MPWYDKGNGYSVTMSNLTYALDEWNMHVPNKNLQCLLFQTSECNIHTNLSFIKKKKKEVSW